MNISKPSCVALLLALLTACGTAYHPVGDYGGIPHGGYSSTRINSNTVVVNFNGNLFTPQQTVDNYLLYRAAKITIDNGYNYFIITSSSMCNQNVKVNTSTTYSQTEHPPKLYNSYYYDQKYQSSQTSLTRFPVRNMCSNQSPSHEAQAVIKMFQGSVPPGVPHAYDALDIVGHLGEGTTPGTPTF